MEAIYFCQNSNTCVVESSDRCCGVVKNYNKKKTFRGINPIKSSIILKATLPGCGVYVEVSNDINIMLLPKRRIHVNYLNERILKSD